MPSLSNIPEPTTGYRPDDNPPAPQAALQTLDAQADASTNKHASDPVDPGDEPQQQIDSVSCLLLLLIAGGLLRLVLGLFGPMQGTDPDRLQALAEQGRLAFTSNPSNAFPVPGLLAAGLSTAGASGWVMVAIGSLLTLAATPAAYVIGRAATGRRIAGILAAALITVHPAVLMIANTLSGTAVALSLVTIGLALALHSAKRGYGFALAGGMTLALAGLAAPLCWVVAVLAGPFVGHVNQHHGTRRALLHAATVFVLALGPIAGYRAATHGMSADVMLVEFRDTADTESDLPALDRTLITLTDSSLTELGEALHLPIGDAGHLTRNAINAGRPAATTADPVANALADGWLLMNMALAALATVSVGVMLVRRRLVETLVLATPLIALGFASVPPGEVLRLPMITLLGVLAAGLLCNRPVPLIDEEARSERAARRAAKLAEKEEKERARQERGAAQQAEDLYAFDKPDRRAKRARAKQARQAKTSPEPEQPNGILTERVADESSVPARPI